MPLIPELHNPLGSGVKFSFQAFQALWAFSQSINQTYLRNTRYKRVSDLLSLTPWTYQWLLDWHAAIVLGGGLKSLPRSVSELILPFFVLHCHVCFLKIWLPWHSCQGSLGSSFQKSYILFNGFLKKSDITFSKGLSTRGMLIMGIWARLSIWECSCSGWRPLKLFTTQTT